MHIFEDITCTWGGLSESSRGFSGRCKRTKLRKLSVRPSKTTDEPPLDVLVQTFHFYSKTEFGTSGMMKIKIH